MNRSGPISGSISGFSLVELVVVLFILSVLAFFSIPVIKGLGPGQDPAGGSRQLAQFIKGVRQKAIRENQDYTLHLDTISGQAWAQVSEDSAQNSEDADKSDDPDKSNDADETQTPGSTLSGISITRVDVFNRPDTDAGTTLIRVGGNGITDMALIHMITREEGDITLKLHPFIQDVDIIQGDLRFNDCP